MQIISRNNPSIKSMRALRERKERERTGLFIAEGIRIVGEAVQLGADVRTLVYSPQLLKSDFARDLIQKNTGIEKLEVSREVFESISDKDGPQGIAAVVQQRWLSLSQFALLNTQFVVALDSPQDPGNIGTILRTCDAAGASGLILLGNHADPYDASAIRASMGALFSVPLVRATYAEFAAWQHAHKTFVVGTSDQAHTHYRTQAYETPLVLLMGSERQGLVPELMQLCNAMVCIPMFGRSDSLNLAVATGIMLYDIQGKIAETK